MRYEKMIDLVENNAAIIKKGAELVILDTEKAGLNPRSRLTARALTGVRCSWRDKLRWVGFDDCRSD